MTAGPYRQIPFAKRLQGPAVTYRTAVIMEDGRLARPSLPTLPGTDGTMGRQGPGVRTGRLGTLLGLGRVSPFSARANLLESFVFRQCSQAASPASEVHLTRPGWTADIYRLSSANM